MEKRLNMTRNIDVLIIVAGTIYLLLVAFTEVTHSSFFLLTTFFLMSLIRGIEAQWSGKKIASKIIFSVSLFFLIIIIYILVCDT
ncbi:hypothetical protein HLI_12505 [Halobacillus litoralis]|uniref:DUF3953 domain-containing protein n=1 Tax=Halobacillus litoralis TaxID=45668 RepID=A0A410ME67_9BACI|nr:hypothetical protein HLI_12505 [Halobacillus litoralis]